MRTLSRECRACTLPLGQQIPQRSFDGLKSLEGLGSLGGFGSLWEPFLAKEGAAASVSIAGGTYAIFFTNFLRDSSCLYTGSPSFSTLPIS